MKVPLTGYAAVLSTMIPPLVGLIKWKTLNKQMKYFALYCIINAAIAGIEMCLASIKTNNHFIITFSYLAEVLAISVFYYSIFVNRNYKKFMIYGVVIFTIYWLIDNLFFASKLDINQSNAIVSRVLLIILSILIVQEFYTMPNIQMTRSPFFWIAAAVLISSSGSIFTLGMINEMMNSSSNYFSVLWHLDWILIILTNSIFTVSFFLPPV